MDGFISSKELKAAVNHKQKDLASSADLE